MAISDVKEYTHLTPEQLEELAREFDTIQDRVAAELGERDRRYIEAMIEMQRRLAVMGRVGLLLPRFRPLAIGAASGRSPGFCCSPPTTCPPAPPAPPPSRRRRSSRTWRSGTTSCTGSGTG